MKTALISCALVAILSLTGCVYHDRYNRHYDNYPNHNWDNGHHHHDRVRR